MGTSEADQTLWAMLTCGQGTKMGSHVTQVATRGKSGPLFRGRVLYPIFAVMCVVQTATSVRRLYVIDVPGLPKNAGVNEIRLPVQWNAVTDSRYGRLVVRHRIQSDSVWGN